jgi:hypothetical protein
MSIFRRRRFPRARLPRRVPLAGRRAGVPRGALHELRRANRLMAERAYARAASIYEELADEAQAQGIWRSPQLNIQAGMGWVMAGEIAVGMNRIIKGIRLMPEMGQAGRLQAVAARVRRNLQELGLEDQANSLDKELEALLPSATDLAEAIPLSQSRGTLPVKCPHCGGNVLPNEVEWVDAKSAICDYCGSLIQSSR